MLKKDVDTLKALLHEYGASETLNGLIVALRSVRDDLSDMGLKEKAAEADGAAWALEMLIWAPSDPFEDSEI
jgi:hypothetical protein